MEELENNIVKLLNQADNELTKEEFNMLAESIIDYIDEISRSKRNDGLNEEIKRFNNLI